VPTEYWEVFLIKDKSVTEAQRRVFLATLDKYFMVGVVRADISRMGVFSFHGEQDVFDSIRIALVKPNEKPLLLKLLLKAEQEEAQRLVEFMKPMLRAPLGQLGENFHLFLCPNHDRAGRRYVSPYDSGKLMIKLGPLAQNKGGMLEFDYPLNSLHVPRVCTDCRKEAHISWSFCPFCGKKHVR
jgi:hypothetical protein